MREKLSKIYAALKDERGITTFDTVIAIAFIAIAACAAGLYYHSATNAAGSTINTNLQSVVSSNTGNATW